MPMYTSGNGSSTSLAKDMRLFTWGRAMDEVLQDAARKNKKRKVC